MVRGKKSKKIAEGDGFSVGGSAILGVSLGALLRGTDADDAAEEKKNTENAKAAGKGPVARPGKASLRKQTAGRGGKTVTVVIISEDSNADAEVLAKELRKALGCGSRAEGRDIVLQGDMRERAAEWLSRRGFTVKM